MKRKLFLALIVAWLSCQPMAYAADTPPVTARWTPPTSGSPAVKYELEVYADGERLMVIETTETEALFAAGVLQWLTEYTARVRAFDALDRAGPFGEFGDPLVLDQGPPSACGTMDWIVGR